MERARIAMIGLGDIAEKAYLPVLGAHPEVELIGLASRSEATVERVGRRFRVEQRFTELKDLLALEPEAVFVHSPTDTHYAVVMECLKAGAAVYVDKPLSYDIRESEAMAEEAAKRGLLLAVGFNRRFAPLYRQAKAWVEEKGGFQLCAAEKHRPSQQRHVARLTLYDDLIHMVDLVSWLCGGTEQLEAYRQSTDAEGRLVWASGSVEAPGWASFSMSRGAGLDLERLELHGGGRSAQVVNLERAVLSEGGSVVRESGFGSWDSVSVRRGFAGAVEHFLQTRGEPGACELRAEQVLPTHRLIERMIRTAEGQ